MSDIYRLTPEDIAHALGGYASSEPPKNRGSWKDSRVAADRGVRVIGNTGIRPGSRNTRTPSRNTRQRRRDMAGRRGTPNLI